MPIAESDVAAIRPSPLRALPLIVSVAFALAPWPVVAAEGDGDPGAVDPTAETLQVDDDTSASGSREVGELTTYSGNRFSVGAGEASRGNVYVMTSNAHIDGVVEGDAAVFANSLDVNGRIAEDLMAACSRVDVDGVIGGDARLAVGEIFVDGEIGGELIALTGRLEIGSEAKIGGPLLVAAGQVDLRGTVEGPVEIGTGRLVLAGTILGDARIEADELVIEPEARILGDLRFSSRTVVDIPDGVVAGVATQITNVDAEHQIDAERVMVELGSALTGLWLAFYLYLAVVGLFAGALMWLFFRPFVDGALGRSSTPSDAGASFGAGFVSVMVLLVLGVFCVFLLPLSLAILAAFGALLYFGSILGKMLLGRWLLTPLLGRPVHPLLGMLVGIVVLFIVGLVPFVGWLPWLVMTLIGMGAALLQIRGGSGPAPAGGKPAAREGAA